ncbi:hypothetical protein QQ020_34800 [Fulvivirgaceae bacterium BMA12]|uniref:Uncharacterized protein n=1 Tax=Agaribacillus aureus TaxID=3051825 RepID=A0ABT8LKP9_9BACT|nr:hypothetical protein [Fulvivirgaceae bacterium BMA12]
MAITTTIIACLLLYGTSKYFPEGLATIGIPLRKNRKLVLLVSILFLGWSVWSFTSMYDTPTAIIVWAVVLMTVLSALVLSVKTHPNWLVFWGLLVAGSLIYDFI